VGTICHTANLQEILSFFSCLLEHICYNICKGGDDLIIF